MTYNVFGGTLNLTQPVAQSSALFIQSLLLMLTEFVLHTARTKDFRLYIKLQ